MWSNRAHLTLWKLWKKIWWIMHGCGTVLVRWRLSLNQNQRCCSVLKCACMFRYIGGVYVELTAASRQQPGGWCPVWAAQPPWGSKASSQVRHWGYWQLQHWRVWLSYWMKDMFSQQEHKPLSVRPQLLQQSNIWIVCSIKLESIWGFSY